LLRKERSGEAGNDHYLSQSAPVFVVLMRYRNSKDNIILYYYPTNKFLNNMSKLNKTFKATIEKSNNKGGWTYVIWPESAAYFKTKGLVKIAATVNNEPFKSSFMALGDGRHKLPIKADLRKKIGKDAGDVVSTHLLERLD